VGKLEALVRIAPPSGRVLDPFMGSATTGVAALRAELGFTGAEMAGGGGAAAGGAGSSRDG